MTQGKLQARLRRKKSIRKRVNGTSERPRLTVFRSAKHIYAQVIDDAAGVTLVSASTLEKGLDEAVRALRGIEAATAVGKLVAERCKEKEIAQVVFDRNGYKYHGRVRAIADAAREAGLEL